VKRSFSLELKEQKVNIRDKGTYYSTVPSKKCREDKSPKSKKSWKSMEIIAVISLIKILQPYFNHWYSILPSAEDQVTILKSEVTTGNTPE